MEEDQMVWKLEEDQMVWKLEEDQMVWKLEEDQMVWKLEEDQMVWKLKICWSLLLTKLGLNFMCAKCRPRIACAVRTGKSRTTLSTYTGFSL
ncbi:hypothetical protein DPMN_027780 [Dreissena polymorpha]|uniref:Uncharacterized protein n=1 Tax=Dreissena polymorpha TaxID=45954 RepID=A0A9D4LVT6_DREPO|nr:hypothetical protein DPMN_027780 [Dreissena polymorpha]